MTHEPISNKTMELLDACMVAINAIRAYEALLRRPHDEVTEAEFKAIHKTMFTQARQVDRMQVRNLLDALNCGGEPGYQDYLRRN